jgi:hypothetical protein
MVGVEVPEDLVGAGGFQIRLLLEVGIPDLEAGEGRVLTIRIAALQDAKAFYRFQVPVFLEKSLAFGVLGFGRAVVIHAHGAATHHS